MKAGGLAIVLVLLVCASSAAADSAELVTVTTDSAVATWFTAEPSDTTACVTPGGCRTTETGVRYHRPSWTACVPSPGSFTTLTPPPGRHLLISR